jgi:hypothetical protein
LARHALFTVANLVLNLFKFSSLALISPLESCSFITSLRAAVTDTSFPVLRTGGVISQYMRFVAPLVPFSPISYQLLMM